MLLKSKKNDDQSEHSKSEKENLSSSINTEIEKPMPTDKKDRAYHDIKIHLEKIHNKKSEIEDPWLKKVEAFSRLRKIIRKL
jgi:protein-tyrosine-phosphatase